jgi:hypothetical protein
MKISGSDTDLNPLGRGRDPLIRIRTKMSRIRNTEYKTAHVLWTSAGNEEMISERLMAK